MFLKKLYLYTPIDYHLFSGKDSVSEDGFYSKIECEARYDIFIIANYFVSRERLSGLD